MTQNRTLEPPELWSRASLLLAGDPSATSLNLADMAGTLTSTSPPICGVARPEKSGRYPLEFCSRSAGLRTAVLASLPRADYHPAAGEAAGVLTYCDGDQVRSAKLSWESEVLGAAVLDR